MNIEKNPQTQQKFKNKHQIQDVNLPSQAIKAQIANSQEVSVASSSHTKIDQLKDEVSLQKKNFKKGLTKTQKGICVASIIFSLLLIMATTFIIVIYTRQAEGQILEKNLNGKKTVVIMGTTDIHGRVYPTPLFRSDTEQVYNYGGLTYLISLMKTVANQNPDSFLYLDSGDQYQGGFQSSKFISSGQIMNDFYNTAKLKTSTLGNHEFDNGPTFLFNYMNGRDTPFVVANIRSETGASDFLPNQKSTQIFEISEGIKIGVIGLITTQTPVMTAAFLKKQFPAYQFLDYPETVLQKSKQLRQRGADAVIVLSHVGNQCENNFTYGIWTQKNSSYPCPYDQITRLIDALPAGTIDAVLQGHTHRIAHYYYKGVPFMGTTNGGYYTNFLYLRFDKDKKIVSSHIQGPVPICQKVFQNTRRCDYVEKSQIQNAGKLVNWEFHKVQVKQDQYFSTLINNKWGAKMQPYKQIIVKNEVILMRYADRQTQLGNLFTDLLRDVVPLADFSILNYGGFRTSWFPGVINYQLFYNMFPFDNLIVSFEVTGTQIIQTLKVLQSGPQFFPVSNLQSQVEINNSTKVRTVLASRFLNGMEIQPDTLYKGVTINFLLNAGDRFSQAVGTTFVPKNVQVIGDFRTLIKPKLKALQVIRAGTLIDPANPRLILTYV